MSRSGVRKGAVQGRAEGHPRRGVLANLGVLFGLTERAGRKLGPARGDSGQGQLLQRWVSFRLPPDPQPPLGRHWSSSRPRSGKTEWSGCGDATDQRPCSSHRVRCPEPAVWTAGSSDAKWITRGIARTRRGGRTAPLHASSLTGPLHPHCLRPAPEASPSSSAEIQVLLGRVMMLEGLIVFSI